MKYHPMHWFALGVDVLMGTTGCITCLRCRHFSKEDLHWLELHGYGVSEKVYPFRKRARIWFVGYVYEFTVWRGEPYYIITDLGREAGIMASDYESAMARLNSKRKSPVNA